MIKTGIPETKLPAGIEIEILIDYVKRRFGKITEQEFNDAFEMAFEGKLEIDAKLYDKLFCCEYVGRVLSAYREYLRENTNDGWIRTPGERPIPRLN